MSPNSNQENDVPDPHETFLRLWMQHEPELRAFVRSCCPNAQEVDDVMQEVSVAALCGSFRRSMIIRRLVRGPVSLHVTNCFRLDVDLPGIG